MSKIEDVVKYIDLRIKHHMKQREKLNKMGCRKDVAEQSLIISQLSIIKFVCTEEDALDGLIHELKRYKPAQALEEEIF